MTHSEFEEKFHSLILSQKGSCYLDSEKIRVEKIHVTHYIASLSYFSDINYIFTFNPGMLNKTWGLAFKIDSKGIVICGQYITPDIKYVLRKETPLCSK